MIGSLKDHRKKNRSSRSRSTRPSVEGLEDRMLLYATEGAMWQFGSRITYSFVPDGTSIGGVSSNLFSTLNASYTTSTWEAQFEKAAAQWASYSNINLAQVSDNGEAMGAAGDQQDDPHVGDIRISMIPMGTNGVLAFTMLPPAYNGGTDAGDIVFNSSYAWGINNGNYDVETVALHEMGHALGMAHSTSTTAAMYGTYEGVNQMLMLDDQQGIASIYGSYPGMTESNKLYASATNITPNIVNNQIAISGLNIAGPSDSNWFKVTAPSTTTGTMTVSMQSTNLSSLSPRLLVYNSASSPVLLGQAAMTNQWGATATVTLTGVTPNTTYYLKTVAATSPGAYGAYGLLVNFGSGTQSPIAPPNTVVAAQPDQGGGSADFSLGGVDGNVDASWTSIDASIATAPDPTEVSGEIDPPTTILLGSTAVAGDFLTTNHAGRYPGHSAKPRRTDHEKILGVRRNTRARRPSCISQRASGLEFITRRSRIDSTLETDEATEAPLGGRTVWARPRPLPEFRLLGQRLETW